MTSNSPPKLCQICLKQSQKYSCPRCNIFYCSVNCYKSQSHSQCSESFYKDCVIQEISQSNSTLNDSSATKQMQEILKRLEGDQTYSETCDLDNLNSDEEDSDDDLNGEGENELSERLREIDLNDADAVWNKLTIAEKQEFENIVKNGDISNLCLIKEPWWINKCEPKKIEEINSITNNHQNLLDKNIPTIHKSILEFEKISSKTPSETVFYNIKNILSAYTLTIRYFYGDLLIDEEMATANASNNQYQNSLEACNYLISICANLKSNINFDDSDLAVDSVVHQCRTEGLIIHKDQVKQIHEDVDNLIQGPNKLYSSNLYILSALSDLYRLILAGKQSLINHQDSDTKNCNQKSSGEFSKRFFDHEIIDFKIVNKKNLSYILKKIEYFLSYVKKFK